MYGAAKFGRALVLICWPLAAMAVATQPNVIFILTDDLGVGDIGPYGQQTIQTPNLDQMAAAGMTFSRMYSGAPVCSPSRATLFTGLHNGRHNNGNGVSLPSGTATTAQVLREAGYDTAMFGKLHLGGPNALWGFDRFYGIVDGVQAWDHFRPTMDVGMADASGRISTITSEANNGGYTDDLVGAEAVQYVMDQAGGGQPFYAQVNFQIAHFDMEVPTLEPYTVNQPWDESRKIFASMVTRLDSLVGDIRDAVDDPNGDGDNSDSIADNTVIVFASDNGTHIEPQSCCTGNHGPDIGFFSDDPHDPEFFDSNGGFRGWKRDLYDGGIHTPFLVEWQGETPAGSTSAHYGDFSDFLPTVAELAGVEAPIQVDGESYAHVLTGDARALPPVRDDLYFEFTGGSAWSSTPVAARHALVRDGYKAIRFADGDIELYDLANDPGETNDLAAALPALAQQMIDDALVQDVGQLAYRQSSPAGAYFDQSSSWGGATAPDFRAVGTVRTDSVDHDLFVEISTDTLALDIGGGAAQSRLVVLASAEVTAANGIRIRANGELRVEDSQASSNRRIDLAGGRLTGRGLVTGQTVNAGQVAPDGASTTPPARTEPATILAFDFLGVQDDAPLTATSALDPNLTIVGGLDFGPGTQARSDGPDGFTGSDQGNEFNIGGFNTPSLASAIVSQDFLSYTVQAAPGFEVTVESVSFQLWRNGANAANDYAILTSLDGFADGDQIAELNNQFGAGAGSSQTFTGFYTGGQSTGDPIEVRLYAWNANDSLASTHITDVTMTGAVSLSGAANIGQGASAEGYGVLAVNGSYIQQPTGRLTIDVGGVTPGVDLDQLAVVESATLSGELEVLLTDGFVPAAGDEFVFLVSRGVTGVFDNVALPDLVGGLWLSVEYSPGGASVLVQGVLGDYNLDGVVDAADYTVWRDSDGQTGEGLAADGNGDGQVDTNDYEVWSHHFGRSAVSPTMTVPEPSAVWLLAWLVRPVLAGRELTTA